ncbi:hypothetical protein KO527_25645 [Pseudoalteromonas sp. C2R02]|uniref:hypothetical protein n=1 Tax=Pseudoalteromonas sp. C2R02 TaxID=2841565 RepID=UPI001C09C464|nr:hypothetical protein [Pseudoalteromonas sp. C2R02]MBU2972721.1 hypothetical protein [Pseudoalteromonas sp. C2R02]
MMNEILNQEEIDFILDVCSENDEALEQSLDYSSSSSFTSNYQRFLKNSFTVLLFFKGGL